MLLYTREVTIETMRVNKYKTGFEELQKTVNYDN